MRDSLLPLRTRLLESVIIFVGLLALAALTAAGIEGGTGLVAELEEVVIRFTWPPLIALAALLVFATWRPPLPPGLYLPLALLAWVLSAIAYSLREGIPNRTEDITASAVLTAAPIVAFLLLFEIGRQLRLHRYLEAGIGALMALILSWGAAFIAAAVGCAVPGACP